MTPDTATIGREEKLEAIRPHGNTKHGMAPRNGKRHPMYWSWHQMIQRCTNPNNKSYRNYGGRGIGVYREWRVFARFTRDMGKSYFPGATIERKNVNGNYEPGNCCWIPKSAQAKNRRPGSQWTRKSSPKAA